MILGMIASPLDGRTQHEFTQIDEKQILFHLLLQTREGCHARLHWRLSPVMW